MRPTVQHTETSMSSLFRFPNVRSVRIFSIQTWRKLKISILRHSTALIQTSWSFKGIGMHQCLELSVWVSFVALQTPNQQVIHQMYSAPLTKNSINGLRKSPFKRSLSAITLIALTMKSRFINSSTICGFLCTLVVPLYTRHSLRRIY